MKKFCSNLCSITSRICMAGLALLGFGCNGGDDYPLMYGTPTADFEVKGMVTDADGNAVKGAEVRVTGSEAPSGVYVHGKATTEESGAYSVFKSEMIGSPKDKVKVVCIPSDGTLEADSTVVTLKKVSDGDGNWYGGKGEATVNFKLKKKTAE